MVAPPSTYALWRLTGTHFGLHGVPRASEHGDGFERACFLPSSCFGRRSFQHSCVRISLEPARIVFPPPPPTAESFGVSAQIGSGVVWGGPEVRFHEGSTRVPPDFHQGSTRVPPGFHQGSTRVPQGSTRVPRGSERAAEWCEH